MSALLTKKRESEEASRNYGNSYIYTEEVPEISPVLVIILIQLNIK
jgi:hypothetical protein